MTLNLREKVRGRLGLPEPRTDPIADLLVARAYNEVMGTVGCERHTHPEVHAAVVTLLAVVAETSVGIINGVLATTPQPWRKR